MGVTTMRKGHLGSALIYRTVVACIGTTPWCCGIGQSATPGCALVSHASRRRLIRKLRRNAELLHCSPTRVRRSPFAHFIVAVAIPSAGHHPVWGPLPPPWLLFTSVSPAACAASQESYSALGELPGVVEVGRGVLPLNDGRAGFSIWLAKPSWWGTSQVVSISSSARTPRS